MKKSIKLAVALAAVLVLLAVTKPNEESFETYIDKKYTPKDNSKNTELENLVNKAIKTGVNIQANTTKTYVDHTLYAMVTTKELLDEEHYIGILGFWFSTKKN